jgi:hypothetical protein
MKINGTKTEYIDVEVSEREFRDLIINHIEQKFDVYRDDFIKDNDLYREYEYSGSHTWYETKKKRKASELDKAVLKVLIEL